MADNAVRRQRPIDYTVKIVDPKDKDKRKAIGTGIIVSEDGMVVTCAHVIKDALGVHPRDAGERQVTISHPHPLSRGGGQATWQAKIAGCFHQHDDDVVLLEPLADSPTLDEEQVAVLGKCQGSEGHNFQSYGFASVPPFDATSAEGTIIQPMPIDPEYKISLQIEMIELRTEDILKGLSGSGVLDMSEQRNLVVGILTRRWNPEDREKQPAADVQAKRRKGWAVDAQVLSLEPLGLPLHEGPYPLREAAGPRDVEAARTAAGRDLGVELVNAPPSLDEWVGREDLLNQITGDWLDERTRVTGLIGFGGEGKSSLARRWLDDLLADNSIRQPDGVFWWGFYDQPSVDEFFEAALDFLGQGEIDPAAHPSANAKAHFIAGMLHAGRYLFVLDGLEVMQHQEGDDYGLLRSNDLADFLKYFSLPAHDSFCVITSRAPVLDLMDFTTYVHRDVMRLSARDGRDLLRKLGVRGSDEELDQVVADWDGHALTLSLMASYLVDFHSGKAEDFHVIPPPTADEDRYERVHRVLRRYDEHLNEAERAFLKLFSAFRKPVKEEAFTKVFRTRTEATDLNAPIVALSEADFRTMVERLVKYRILRHDEREMHYTAHPLIRRHYEALLVKGDQDQTRAAHVQIARYYAESAGDVQDSPSLDKLAPWIEVVHHACQAGAYDESNEIFISRIDQGNRFVLGHQLGAYDTLLNLMREFFPDSDPSQEPLVTRPEDKAWLLNTVGFCLMNLGRLGRAAPFYMRSDQIYEELDYWRGASRILANLSELHAYLGDLAASAQVAEQALDLAQRAQNKVEECQSLAHLGLATYFKGNMEGAGKFFQLAEGSENQPHLYSNRGVFHADYLRRVGEKDYARRVIEANIKVWVELSKWQKDESACHRVLGDLDADDGQHDTARENFVEALRLARSITHRPTLIEALLARGRWYAKHMKDSTAAFSDLNEALGYATRGEYRIYEADIRNALAWAHLVAGDRNTAQAEAERARTMSKSMGYHWGQVDADEVLGEIQSQG